MVAVPQELAHPVAAVAVVRVEAALRVVVVAAVAVGIPRAARRFDAKVRTRKNLQGSRR
jgi:hypothetical protein